jgi:Raf kinase inhibitor-like YbhB/YbcL family protein
MSHLRRWLFASGLILAIAGCSSSSKPAASTSTPINVTSPAFAEGNLIPAQYTCIQAGTSPPLAWTPNPAGTTQWAVVMEDTDAHFVHWVVSGLAGSVKSLAANQLPKGTVVSQGSNGAAGYIGPCPPPGKVHHYRVTVYALGHKIQLDPKTPTKDSLQSIQQASIDKGTLTGRFGR